MKEIKIHLGWSRMTGLKKNSQNTKNDNITVLRQQDSSVEHIHILLTKTNCQNHNYFQYNSSLFRVCTLLDHKELIHPKVIVTRSLRRKHVSQLDTTNIKIVIFILAFEDL